MTHSTDTTIRDTVARAFSRTLSVLVPRRPRRRRPGRHSARYLLAAVPPPAPPQPPDQSPRAYAWSTPVPDHVRARRAPLRGEETRLVRPYVRTETTPRHSAVTRERRRAAALAALGVDYPYTYEGAPFPLSAFAPTRTAAEATA
ncbi:hypothetical protein [Streptomyces sp. NPDC006012]|uniref:hypothetical protein n=1 Tax=Streptomyces sp. NPDC006012 TaxID=3364739 RepID=UPI0036958FCF